MKLFLLCLMIVISLFSLDGNEITPTEESMHTPQYLYKILSMRSWQATQKKKCVILTADDDAFIHLATEEQIEKIVAKFFPDEPEYAILKLDTTKLQGNLVYESNPGGTTKYYHLYNGFIPFNAIIESKIVYRDSSNGCKDQVLEVLQMGDPVLRQQARELTKEEILSPEIQKLIQEMTATMRAAPGVGVAAPQIGKSIQLIVIEDPDHSHLTPEQIKERDRTIVPLHVIINPKLVVEEADTAEFFEGCLSVDGLVGIVPRAKAVRVECLNERAEPVVIKAKGWYARILQHEIDHLRGTLFLDKVYTRSLTNDTNFIKIWKTKTIAEVKSALNRGDNKHE